MWCFLILCVLYVSKGVYGIYDSKTEKWREQAKEIFEEVLMQETQRWERMSTQPYMDTGANEKKESKKRYTYLIPSDSLDANELNKKWRELLYETDIPVKTCIKISTFNASETLESYSDSSFQPASRDSLFSFYVGVRREVEVTGFISYHWWNVLDGRLPIVIIMLVIGLGISMFTGALTVQIAAYWKSRGKAAKIEKHANIAMIDNNEPTTFYHLEEDVVFDSNRRIIKRKEEIEKLTPQQAGLLEAFLKADQYKLTQKEIDTLLWPDGSGTAERLYTAICRLRKSLERMSSFRIDSQIDIYQLKK